MTASLPAHCVTPSRDRIYPKHAIAASLIYGVLLLLCFGETAWSIVSIWIRSETYTHGFLILPIVGWMIWGRRERFYSAIEKPDFVALLPLAGCGFTWLLGSLVDVLVVQQFALVGMLICGVWVILGRMGSWQIAFPLAYLLFLVPTGEGLVPPMMEYTATFTVAMVELTGIPVYREGMYFVLPSGNWSVVEACSGVRYLIASAALGTLYAYINFQSILRRSVFIVIAIVVPIVANGFRAYFIVMLGHVSDMTIATGVDHLIYGWVFFGVVMFLLFYIGSFWQENEVEGASDVKSVSSGQLVPNNRIYASFFAAAIAVLVWPYVSWAIDQNEVAEWKSLELPAQIGMWRQVAPDENWAPVEEGVPDNFHAAFETGSDVAAVPRVQIFVQSFNSQNQGAELVSGRGLLRPDRKRWRIVNASYSSELSALIDSDIKETIVREVDGKQYLVWFWYRVGDNYLINDYKAKLLEATNKLTFGRLDSSRIFLSVPLDDQRYIDEARTALKSFVVNSLDIIEAELDASAGM